MQDRHHPDIQAVLDALAPPARGSATRAAAALHLLLQPLYALSGRVQAWHASQLTGDGFPVEFAFTTADASIRYTVDPGEPGVSPAARLAQALDLLDRLGQPPVDRFVAGHLERSQRSQAPSYGAWLGGRHSAAGDSFKLYAEVPNGSLSWHGKFLETALGAVPHLPDRPLCLRMVGCEPAAGRIECYFRAEWLQCYHIALLLRVVGLAHRADELLTFLEQAYGYPLRDKIPGGSAGFSYSLTGGVPAFTLFLFGRALWGGDCRIRRHMGACLRGRGQDPGPYLQATALLACRDVYQTYHGMVGLSVADRGPVSVGVGVRPPPHSPADCSALAPPALALADRR